MPVSYPGYRPPGVIVQAEKLAATSIEILKDQLILPGLFDKHAEAEFKGAMNDMVNIKRPSWIVGKDPLPLRKDRTGYPTGPFNESGFAQGIGYQDSQVNEFTIPIKIDRDLYSSFKLTDEMLTLDIESYAVQILQPQTRAIAERYEKIVAEAMKESFQPVDYPAGGTGVIDATDPDPLKASAAIRKAILLARKNFNDRNVPASGRKMIIGSAVEALLLQDPNLIRADWAGDSNALRQAEIGSIYGFSAVQTNSIDENAIFWFHPTALQLISMAPAVPQGAPFSSSMGAHGLALRYIRDYDYAWAQDRSLMNVYFGVGEVVDYATAEEQTAADETKLRQYRGMQATVDFR